MLGKNRFKIVKSISDALFLEEKEFVKLYKDYTLPGMIAQIHKVIDSESKTFERLSDSSKNSDYIVEFIEMAIFFDKEESFFEVLSRNFSSTIISQNKEDLKKIHSLFRKPLTRMMYIFFMDLDQ